MEVLRQRFLRGYGTSQVQMPGKEEGRKESEGEQGKTSLRLALPASGGFNEGT